MNREHPYLEVTKPNGSQYKLKLNNIIAKQTTAEIYIAIGRQSNNHIVLNDPQKKVSRHHCSLHYKDNCWWIIDQGSANGTFLQREIDRPEIDVRAENAVAIRSGDRILILGELDSAAQPLFWRLEFIDPGETIQLSTRMQTLLFLEYSLSRQTLYRNLVRRRDPVSLGEQERCLIDYMSHKNHQSNQSVICGYDELIQAVWQDHTFGRDRKAINHLVWRIRDKIELDSGKPQFLKTIKGRGYLLDIKIIE